MIFCLILFCTLFGKKEIISIITGIVEDNFEDDSSTSSYEADFSDQGGDHISPLRGSLNLIENPHKELLLSEIEEAHINNEHQKEASLKLQLADCIVNQVFCLRYFPHLEVALSIYQEFLKTSETQNTALKIRKDVEIKGILLFQQLEQEKLELKKTQ